MEYRQFGKLDWRGSALGFGAMRLPVSDGGLTAFNPNVDEELAIKMIRYCIDNGVNYVDTAYPYHSGKSEVVVGKALKDGYRDRIKIATKLLSRNVNTAEDFDKNLDEQLERLQLDSIDFYLLHGMNSKNWPKLRDLGVLKWAEKTMAKGRFQYLGFSFHDNLETFKEIINAYDNWTSCQIQYNYMDTELQAGTQGLRYAAEKGLAVVIMEPVRGGQLVRQPPEAVQKIWDNHPQKKTPADWAFQWIWNQPEVSVVLSGMSDLQQVIENVESAKNSKIGSLSNEDLALIDQVTQAYKSLSPVPCTSCGYCMPCPNGVNIPHAFMYYNDSMMYDDARVSRFRYRQIPQEEWADNCIECGECEEKCPQSIQIIDWLKKSHAWLGPKKK